MLISSRNTLLDTPRRIFGHITGYHADQEHGKGQANQNSVLRQLTGPWCQSEHPRILLLKVRSLLTVASHRCLVWILGSTPDLLNQKLYRGPGNLYYYKLLRYLKCGKCWFIESYKSSFLAWNLWARYVWNQDLFFSDFQKIIVIWYIYYMMWHLPQVWVSTVIGHTDVSARMHALSC